MKLVIMLVPDQMTHVGGSRRGTFTEEVEVTKGTILQALGPLEDYHAYYHFKDTDKVKVLTIENWEELISS